MFDLPRPCDNCPFRRVGGIRLPPERVREIAQAQADPDGGAFPCHKTVPEEVEQWIESHPEIEHPMVWVPQMQYCAGAIVFARKQGNRPALLQIAERMEALRPELGWRQTTDAVFDSVLEMVAAQTPRTPPRKKRGPLGGRKDRRQR